MRDDAILHPKDSEVAAKIIEGEAILINLSNGMYYSMAKVGAHLWSLLAGGASINRLADAIAAHYDIPEAQAKADVRGLVDELHGEGLIVEREAESPAMVNGAAPAGDVAASAYEKPRLVKYDDMADMFALDPPLPELPSVSN
jgi:hypothetical protein